MTTPSDGMAQVKIPANLPDLVRTAFSRAVASGDVHFFPSQVTLLNVNSIPFQLRYSPALANKPRAPQPPPPTTDAIPEETAQNKETKPFFDPFDSTPAPMLITPLPPSHNLVLNKFAIVPEHFILATQVFKEQTHLLEKADLEVAYACIEAYHSHAVTTDQDSTLDGMAAHGGGEEGTKSDLYVFFNSGPASGSSQPHRHIQLLPVPRMREGLSEDEGRVWEVLAGTLLDDGVSARVPFRAFAERIGGGEDLQEVYLRLYRRACEAVLGSAEAEVEGGWKGQEARVDYNLAMTRDVMVIAPRVAEGTEVSVVGEDGQRRTVGKLALNGSVLAGTALVKTQEEWDALRAEPGQLLELLGRIGVPNVEAPPPL